MSDARISSAHAVFAKLSYEPQQGRDDKISVETRNQKLLFFGSIQHQTLHLGHVVCTITFKNRSKVNKKSFKLIEYP